MKKTTIAVVALCCAALASCAPNDSSTAAHVKIAESEQAITMAREAHSENSTALTSADLMLQKAKIAYTQREYQTAVWRAEEAAADARYAMARSAEEQASKRARQLQQSNENLKSDQDK